MARLFGWLTISSSLVAAAMGEIALGLPLVGVLLGGTVLLSLKA